MVLKPSEEAPLSAVIFAEVLAAAGVPAGVFNLVNGDGDAGQALAAHPGVDMVSFTGSNTAGIAVAKAAADTVKRVHQELGGKSANIILPDADLKKAVAGGAFGCFNNSGQSCNAPTRMFVHRDQYEEAVAIAAGIAGKIRVGDPTNPETAMGPVVNARQFARVQGYIERGLAEGARLVAGGTGLPEGLNRGYFVRPTVFADVRPDMTIAREEIFGPVLPILAYESEEEVVALANDTEYGLSGYVSSGDPERARRLALRLRTGNVHLNGAMPDLAAPFGGYKRSGNGREWGQHGFEEFLEVKAIMGAAPQAAAAE
jgi:aldehyde dehydrogenase (NAD+)